MDTNEMMAMSHTEMQHEHSEMNHPSITCKKSCEVSICETYQAEGFVLENTSVDVLPLTFENKDHIVENIFVSKWDPPPIQILHPLTGTAQEGIKLLI